MTDSGEGMKEYESDTGFSSEGSSDEVLEDLERRGVKRERSDDENESELKSGNESAGFKKKKNHKMLHKPPTAEELNHLKETQNLFHSNLFRMQIEEILKEIQVKEKRKIEFEAWFEKFREAVLKLKDNKNKYELTNQEWLKSYQIKIPISQMPYSVNGNFQFKKPTAVKLIGSYATNLVVGPKFVADVLIEIPKTFFQKEDFLNCRYHRKRALYMCELVHHLQLLTNLVENISFVSEEINSLKPNVELIPVGKFNKHISVMLYFCPEKETFKLNRFLPSKNNVRRNWFFKEVGNKQDMVPTPFYNSTVISDLTIQENMQFLKETLLMHNNLRDGILLLKIWIRQRELDTSIGGLSGFLIALLVCYLLQIKKINLLMSSYQIFRNVCNYLIGCDWTLNGITLCNDSEVTNLPTLTDFHDHHKVVFVDTSGYHNLCFAMSTVTFKRIQYEAQFALNCLNNPSINSFQVLFITKVPFYQHYDHLVIFNNEELLENIADSCCSKESQLNYTTVNSHLLRDSIINLLVKGFGNRINQICTRLPKKNRWKVDKKYRQKIHLIVGFNLDPSNYFRVLDKASESETEAFREFWGEKSELRRFQDGTITEAVVWSGRSLAEKRLICKEILSYLLREKFGLESRDFHYLADQLDSFIGSDVEEASLRVVEAFDQLMKQLRDLNDLPLDIVTVQGISPVFRYTDVFPPAPQKQWKLFERRFFSAHAKIKENLNSCPPWIAPVNVMIKMGASTKWPQDLEGIKRIRAAFNIKIAQSLTSQHGITCESFQVPNLMKDRVELIKNGFVFRIRVVYPNEIALLMKTVDADGLIKYKDTEKSLALEKASVGLPKLSSALHGLYQKHNSFGPACCIVKRWISSHLLDGYHISEECIELLVASLYLRSEPNEPPCQPQVAFFRFHYLLATTNWNTDCIILNMNQELTREEIMEIESEFNRNRQNLPPIFIATPYDRKKSVFTIDSPNSLVLLRLIELCANALRIIEGQVYSKTLFNSNILFQPSLDSYDVIITVNDTFNPKKELLSQKSLDFEGEYRSNIPINGFDPVSLYLQELRENYGDLALFFHDSYGGSVIGLIWKPTALEGCDFKILNLPCRKFNKVTRQLELNKEAVLEDFWHIGQGLVRQIDVKINDHFQKFSVFYSEADNK